MDLHRNLESEDCDWNFNEEDEEEEEERASHGSQETGVLHTIPSTFLCFTTLCYAFTMIHFYKGQTCSLSVKIAVCAA